MVYGRAVRNGGLRSTAANFFGCSPRVGLFVIVLNYEPSWISCRLFSPSSSTEILFPPAYLSRTVCDPKGKKRWRSHSLLGGYYV